MRDSIILGFPEDHPDLVPERFGLQKCLISCGFVVEQVSYAWPRNCYVQHWDSIITMDQHGGYADGGSVLSTPDFVLASAAVSEQSLETPGLRMERLKGLYETEEVFILPPPKHQSHLASFTPHIDLTILPIPERRLLIADKFYALSQTGSVLSFIADRFGYSLELVDDSHRKGCEWPCNSLVLPEDSDLLVFTNYGSHGSHLRKVAQEYQLSLVEVPFMKNAAWNGGVKCATHVLPGHFVEDRAFISEEIVL